jgi:hypothetical protein
MRTTTSLLTTAVLVAALAGACALPPAPVAQLTSDERARIDRKRAKGPERFGDPDLAEQFYVNSRTGPIVTRGANPTTGVREISPEAYLPALAQMRAMPRYSTADNATLPSFDEDPLVGAAPGAALGTWSNLGPTNQGGRTRALLIHPTSPNIMYAGGVAGGVWKSTDAGGSWTTTTDLQMNSLAVVALAFLPGNPNTVFAGTGEGFGNGGAARGAGIFRTTDAGVTWTRLASTATTDFHYTMDVVVSTRNTARIYAATRTGVFRSTDNGATWTNLIAVPASGCTDLDLQKSGASGYLFIACGVNTSQGAIYRVLDDGVSGVQAIISGQLGWGRSSLAVAPSAENVLYVMTAQSQNRGGFGAQSLRGIYRSVDSGTSFTVQLDGTVAPTTIGQKISQSLLTNPIIGLATECGQGTSQSFNQGWYDNVLAVDPVNPNRLWAGGIDLFRSDDGGQSFGAAGYWWKNRDTDPTYHHADQHAIVFHPQYNGTSNRTLFSGHDGGVDRIDNALAPVNTTLAQMCGTPVGGGPQWIDRSSGYVTTQFYDGAVYPDGQTLFGGLQDNGTQRGSVSNPAWSILRGGDGGHVAVDTLGDGTPSNDVLFLENTSLSIAKSVNGGVSFASATNGITGDSFFLFIAPFAMNDGNRQHLWTGGGSIWRTTNQAVSWQRATGNNQTCGGGSVSAVAVHPTDANRVLIGMSDGCYHYNHAALSAPNSGIWPGGGFIGSGYISWMAWDPTNINVAYATVSNFGVTNLLKTVDGGATWTARTGSGGTALPQIPALSVVVSPIDGQQVFVGTDLGVFTSVDGGASWFVENTGFANTPVESLKITDNGPRQLVAFTHGRGAWRVPMADGGSGGGGGGGGVQPPVNFRVVSMTGATVTLAWDMPASGPAPEAFQLEGGLAPGAVLGALPIGVTRSVTFALPSAPLYLRMRTIAGGVTSGASNEVLAYVNVPAPPSAPASLLGTAAGGSLFLAWTPTFGGGAPTGAVLEVTGAVNAALPLGAADTFTFAGVPAGTYTFNVRQTNAAGASAPSNPVTLTFPAGCTAAPGVPQRLVAANAGSTLSVFWDPPASGGAPSSYVLNVTGAYVGAVPFTTRTLTLPVPSGTYNFTVAATNPCGTSPATPLQSVTIP